MNGSRRRPTMTDVARAAGVSHQTVSRVLSTPEVVRQQTRESVHRAIETLNYKPNGNARALVTRRSRLIGVVVAQSSYFGPGQTSSSIQIVARERGYGTLVAAIRTSTRSEVERVLELLLEHAVEGLVVIAPQAAHMKALAVMTSNLPVVLVADGLEAPSDMVTISVDQYAGARMAVDHLIARGAADIAHVAGPSDWNDGLQRSRAWESSLEAAGLNPGRRIEGNWSAESGYSAGVKLFKSGLPDAVFAGNDLMALGLLSAATEHAVSIPDDLLVVGFDDAAGTAFFYPSLTTVRQPFMKLGAICVSALLDSVEGCEVEQQRILPELVVRQSTTPNLR